MENSLINHGINLYLDDIIGEIWLPVVGYETNYLVSNFGRVKATFFRKTLNRTDVTIKKQGYNKRGYPTIGLNNGDDRTMIKTVHRLVAKAFIPNPENKATVNHKNAIKTDNSLENLEWATYSENLIHAIDLGIKHPPIPNMGSKHYMSKRIFQLNKNEDIVKEWDCISGAAKELNIFASTISRCCLGKQKEYKGFIWRYAC